MSSPRPLLTEAEQRRASRRNMVGFCALIITILFASALFETIGVLYHNNLFLDGVSRISSSEMNGKQVALTDLAPFDWDALYLFSPYTPKPEIEEAIGFKSRFVQETYSDDMVQYIFVRKKMIVANICEPQSNLGFSIGTAGPILYGEHAKFYVDLDGGFVRLTRVKE